MGTDKEVTGSTKDNEYSVSQQKKQFVITKCQNKTQLYRLLYFEK